MGEHNEIFELGTLYVSDGNDDFVPIGELTKAEFPEISIPDFDYSSWPLTFELSAQLNVHLSRAQKFELVLGPNKRKIRRAIRDYEELRRLPGISAKDAFNTVVAYNIHKAFRRKAK